MNWALFFFSVSLLLASGVILCSFIPFRRWIEWLLGLVLLQFALLVVILNIASFSQRLNQPFFVLILQAGVLLILSVVRLADHTRWHKLPRPAWPRPSQWSRDGWLVALLALFVAVMALNLVYVLAVPPNNNDSLIIHLARIGMWHQRGSWLPWETAVVWQTSFPLNAQLVAYWSLLFTQTDRLLGWFPFVCGLLSAALVYHLAWKMSQKTRLSLLAALAWLAMPVVHLNLTSTRHDHVSGFLLLACFFLLQPGEETPRPTYRWWLAGLALGLAIGTNYAVIAYLPGLAAWLLLGWGWRKYLSWQQVWHFGLASVLSFALLSAPIYASNYRYYGAWLGPDALEMTPQAAISQRQSAISHTITLVGRWGYQLLDTSGLPQPLAGYGYKAKAWLFTQLADKSGITLETPQALLDQHRFVYASPPVWSEDASWFGWWGALLALAGPLLLLGHARRNPSPLLLLILLLVASVAPSMALVRAGWTPYDGRYFLVLMALLCSGSAGLLGRLPPRGQWLLAVLGVGIGLGLLLGLWYNPAKAFWGYRAFYRLHRLDMISAQSYERKDMLYLVDQAVPAQGVLGLATTDSVYYEYGLFGPHFTRTLITGGGKGTPM